MGFSPEMSQEEADFLERVGRFYNEKSNSEEGIFVSRGDIEALATAEEQRGVLASLVSRGFITFNPEGFLERYEIPVSNDDLSSDDFWP